MAVHGSKSVFKIGNAADVLTDISQYINSGSKGEEVETHENTNWGATAKAYIPGLKDGTFSFDGAFDATLDQLLSQILGSERDISYFPAGVGAGLPKYTARAIIKSYGLESPVDDKISYSAEVQVTGGWVRGIAP